MNKPNGNFINGTLEVFTEKTNGAKIDEAWFNVAKNVLPFIAKLVGQKVQAEVKGKMITFIAPFEAAQATEKALGMPVSAEPSNNREDLRQKLIVRQNVLKTATMFLTKDDTIVASDDVIALATIFEKWVWR